MKKSERWEEEEERGWRRHGRKMEGGGGRKKTTHAANKLPESPSSYFSYSGETEKKGFFAWKIHTTTNVPCLPEPERGKRGRTSVSFPQARSLTLVIPHGMTCHFYHPSCIALALLIISRTS